MDPNARKCIFFGYALTFKFKQYQLYNLVSKRLIVWRDLILDEKESYPKPVVGERGE